MPSKRQLILARKARHSRLRQVQRNGVELGGGQKGICQKERGAKRQAG